MEKKTNLGKKTVSRLKPYNSIGKEEINAAIKVLKSGKLSPYLGSWKEIKNIGSFYGGSNVQKFEENIKKYFKVKHAITVNSWTSGLIAAVGALDIEPGDEIIVSTWTMCATATAIIHWMAIPVFADIDKDTFNIDPASIEKKITKRTKAIIVTDIFGQSCNLSEIKKIAKKYNLKIISDSAQSIGAKYKKKYVGTTTDIGGYSLNYHKHIQTGEGGILVTNNAKLAFKMRLIRNHGEAVVKHKKIKNLQNIVGYNFRLGEIEAAIGIEQLKKLNTIVKENIRLAEILTNGIKHLKGVQTPIREKFSDHIYYYYAIKYYPDQTRVSKMKIFQSLKNEGVPIFFNYENVHLLPMFEKQIAYGSKGMPWKLNKDINYKNNKLPVAEKTNNENYLGIPMCNYKLSDKDMLLIVKAFKKVWKNLKIS